jgi:hypothetical protein
VNLVRAIRSGGCGVLNCYRPGGPLAVPWANTGSLTRATERRRLGHDRPPNTWPQDKAPSTIKSSSTEQQTTIDSSEDWNRSQKD